MPAIHVEWIAPVFAGGPAPIHMTNDALRLASVVAPILAAQGEYVRREIMQNRVPNLERWSDAMTEAVFPVWAAVYLAGWRDMGRRIVQNRPRARKSLGRQTFQVPPQRFVTVNEVVREKSPLNRAALSQVASAIGSAKALAGLANETKGGKDISERALAALGEFKRLETELLRQQTATKIVQVQKAEPPRMHAPFFEGVRPHVLDTIRTQVYEFVQATMETSALGVADAIEEFRRTLAEGTERGEGVKLINRRVQEIFQDPYRAARIGQTEASRASHSGQLWAAKESGVVSTKYWVASSDACFGAGSLVLKVDDGVLTPTPIERLRVGDYVLGGSGKPRRVLARASRLHSGRMVRGDRFIATDDHRFLTADGWRPIGEYTRKTRLRRLFNVGVTESQDAPPALLKVTGLPTVLGGDTRFGVPEPSVAKHNRVHAVDDKIDNPFAVHRNLFGECDSGFGEDVEHRYLDVSPAHRGDSVDISAPLGTVVSFSAANGADSRRELGKRLAASGTNARDAFLAIAVPVATHGESVVDGRAFTRAELDVPVVSDYPARLEGFAASEAKPHGVAGNVWLDGQSLVLTGAAAKLGVSLDGSRRDSLLTFTNLASDYCFSERADAEALLAAKAAKFRFATLELAMARLALRDGGCVPCRDVAFVAAKLPSVTSPGVEDCAAYLANVGDHEVVESEFEEVNSTQLVYDIEVEDDQCFMLACGLIAHNCPLCQSLAAKGDIPLDEPFWVNPRGGPYAVVMHPPAHPHDQCALGEGYGEPTDADEYELMELLGV